MRGAPPFEGEILSITLEDALRQSHKSAPEFLTAEETYVIAAIRLLIERHRWGPRLFNDTTLGADGGWSAGDPEGVARIINQLRATQRLPRGGAAEAAWVFNATEQLRETAGGRYRSSSELVLRGTVPLLRGAGDVAREDLIQAERSLVYAARDFERFRRAFLVEIAEDYFQLVQARSAIENQERQLESLKQLDESTRARAEAGRIDTFQVNLTRNQVLQATASLAGLRERYILQLERFKVRLGLRPEAMVDLSPTIPVLPEPEIDLEAATALALEFRLDLQNARDRLDDRRRQLANARNELLPDLDLRGEIGLPTDPGNRSGALDFSPDDTRYSASATLSLPLDREIERLNARQALLALQQASRDFEQQRDNVVVAVRASLRNIELARFQLTIAEQQVLINRRRLEGQRLRADILEPQALVDTQNDLLQAENNRDDAITNLRTAILGYLLTSDQLRVTRDGVLERLPGMDP